MQSHRLLQAFASIPLAAVLAGTPRAEAAEPPRSTESSRFGDASNFRSHEENYLLLSNRMQNNGWASRDEGAMRAHLSFGYVVFARPRDEVSLAYTGEFDFYFQTRATRQSGPVINRLSNPGLHWRHLPESMFGTKTEFSDITWSLEHASDGQVTEVMDADPVIHAKLTRRAQQAYEERDRRFFDTLSRGSHFTALRVRLDGRDFKIPFNFYANLRHYLKQDSDITWGPLAGSGTRLSDYHRLKVGADWLIGHSGQDRHNGHMLSVQWTLGDRGRRTDSFDIGAKLRLQWKDTWDIPLYVRYHRGPLNTLANYTQRQDSLGIGLRFDGLGQ